MHPIVTSPGNVHAVTGVISRTRAYELEKSDPKFPKRVRVGGTTGWLTAELEDYLVKKAGVQSAAAKTHNTE